MHAIDKPFNFRAVVGSYVVLGIVAALAIRFLVLSSPRYHWIFPRSTVSAAVPAPPSKKE